MEEQERSQHQPYSHHHHRHLHRFYQTQQQQQHQHPPPPHLHLQQQRHQQQQQQLRNQYAHHPQHEEEDELEDEDEEDEEEDEEAEEDDDEEEEEEEEEKEIVHAEAERKQGQLFGYIPPSSQMHLHPLASAALSLSQPEIIFSPPMAAMEAEKQPTRDDWNEVATFALLEAWGKKCMQLNRSNLKLEHWAQVAEMVTNKSKTHKTDVQCKNRVDTLKKKFKHEKQKLSMGGGSSKWPFFSVLEKLLDSTPKRGAGGGGLVGAADAGQIVENISAFQVDGRKPTRQEEPKASGSTGSGSKRSLGEYSSSARGNLPNDTNGDHKSSKKRKSKEAPYRILAKAILKFGEIFEKIENSKQQQLRELEKIRMEFTRDLELQRMSLFMQTQVELAKLKHGSIDMDPSVSNMSG